MDLRSAPTIPEARAATRGEQDMRKPLFLTVFLVLGLSIAASSRGLTFTFSTGAPNGLIGTASRPEAGPIEIESADDFILVSQTTIDHATFTGLLPSGAPLTNVTVVAVEIYRVFPLDSTSPPSGHVPTRVNSPSDVAFDSRDSAVPNLTFVSSILNANFTVANSVVNGIHPIPNQTTGGEGPVTGEEVLFDVTFTTPFTLPAGHYFFIPQVALSSGNFLWLSAPKPIVSPGTPFSPDLQSWIRNAALDPDWLRIGTDIVGGTTPPTFNGAFSLSGTAAVVLVVTPVNISTIEGANFSGPVAIFTDNDTSQPASNFAATIDWGDGNTTAGVVSGSAGSFTVAGTHRYADEGSFTVSITVTDTANAVSASATGTATLAEGDVLVGTGLTIAATQGVVFNGAVATFSDTNTTNTASDFTATINWGDASTTAGVVSGGSGAFTVSGSHTYANAGTFPLIVTLTDDAPGTATATATGSASVAAVTIPTLGGIGLLALTLLLAAAGVLALRHR
jgi:hypothetical protein